MDGTLNSPKLQTALVAWGAFCLFGVLLGVQKSLDYSFGTDPWWASVLLIALSVFGWLAIAGIVWFQQRELAFVAGAVRVRRWTDVLLGRPGKSIPLVGGGTARLFGGSDGYSAITVAVRTETIKLPLSFWPRGEAQRLPEILERNGITVEIGGSIFDD